MGWSGHTASGTGAADLQEPVNTGKQTYVSGSMGLKDQLAEILPADVLPYVSDHFEVIGNVAVLAVPAGLEPYKYTIAQAVISQRKNIVTVLNKTEKITGDSRTAPYEVLLGEINGHGAPGVRVFLPYRCGQVVLLIPHGIRTEAGNRPGRTGREGIRSLRRSRAVCHPRCGPGSGGVGHGEEPGCIPLAGRECCY